MVILYGALAVFYLFYYTLIYPHNQKNLGRISNVEFASTYEEYRGKIGYISEDDLENGIKLRGEYDKNTRYIADYAHTSFDFFYQPDFLKDGRPVGVKESSIEKIISLKDNVVFHKSVFFNDQINFLGFNMKYGNGDNAYFVTVPHVVSNYQDEGVFYSDAKTAYTNQTLHTPGATIRVKSDILYKDAKYFASVYFHEDYPQDEKVITFNIPEWLDVEILERNFEGFEITKSTEKFTIGDKKKKKEEEADDSKSEPKPKTEPTKALKERATYITYTIKNLEAIKEESYFPGGTRNMPHLVVLCKKYDKVKAKKDSDAKAKEAAREAAKNNNGKKEPPKTKSETKDKFKKSKTKSVEKPKTELLANTADLYAWNAEIVAMTDNDTSVVAPKALQLVEGLNTDEEKMKAIFYWVQDNIRYVAFEDGIAAFKPDACQNVFNNRYGDCKGMANLLKNMLKCVGFDARLTWIGTKRIAYDYNIPSVAVDNHMICAVFLNGKKYFLDGTESFIGLDDYAHRIQGRPVMIENGKEFLVDTIPDLPVDRNIHARSGNFIVQANGLTGKINEKISGENKTNLLRLNSATARADKEKMLLAYLNDDESGIEVSNVTTSDLSNREIDAVLNYEVKYTNAAFSDGNKIYFKPDNIMEFSHHVIDTPRISDIAYDHKLNFLHDYTFNLPEGYRVKYLPKTINVENEEFSFSVSYLDNGNSIRYKKSIKIKTGYISKRNFDVWNKLVNELTNNYKEYTIIEK
ncbi:MAG: hypothetical protein KA802_18515 [Saprospiraceae bacterium]|nr:hypothetical protein [Saprospiraceae bacterium]